MANLTQLKILEGLSGVLLIDKPEGIPFSSVMKAVKRKFNLIKVGHGGSLDAMASGLFIVLVGDANRFVERVMGADREYEGTLRFGGTTNTGDKYGEKIEDASAAEPDFEKLVKEFKGDVFQTEPRFAAIRREGAAVYEVVDTGEHTQFLGHVYSLSFEKGGSDTAAFRLRATKQVLPRALAQDMNATLQSLRRVKIGVFEVSAAIPFSKLLETEMCDFPSLVRPLAEVL